MLFDKLSYLAVEVTDENNDRSTRHISMTTPECAELLLVAILVQDVDLSNFIEFCLGWETCLLLVAPSRFRIRLWFVVRHGACILAADIMYKQEMSENT